MMRTSGGTSTHAARYENKARRKDRPATDKYTGRLVPRRNKWMPAMMKNR